MKRLSLEYVDYLEAVLLGALAERAKGGNVAPIPGIRTTYAPADVKQQINLCRMQVTKIRWAEVVAGHGFGIGVPPGFAKQAGPGTWVKIHDQWAVEVRENLTAPKGPCLILSDDFVAVEGRLIGAGMGIRID